MNERDDKILRHIGKYGVSIRAVIEKLFFDGATCDHVINRLLKESRIESEQSLPGGVCYYHLTLSEARARSVPEHRARRKKGPALREAVQVLWFCTMSGKNRNRLERKQVAAHFGNGKGSGKPYCAEVEEQCSVVYRVYAPGPNSRDDYLLKTLRIDYEVAQRSELREWIEDRALGFAVLVETEERREKLLRLIKKHGPKEMRILVDVVPGPSNLAEAIRQRRQDSAA